MPWRGATYGSFSNAGPCPIVLVGVIRAGEKNLESNPTLNPRPAFALRGRGTLRVFSNWEVGTAVFVSVNRSEN